MRTTYLSLLLLLANCYLSGQEATLRVDDSYDAERLVNEVFLSGQCESVSNIQAVGFHPSAMAYFEGGQSALGFDRGVILSTGQAALAVGPNSDTDVGFVQDDQITPDLDLSNISTGQIFDKAGIEFDFVPLTPTMTFRYVFASEEYCDFVGEEFNDVFGFFVSGPGLPGSVNIARVPGTDEPVSINNVNYARNSQYYLDNEFPSVRRVNNCGGGGGVGPRFQLIEYDGQTVVLTATVDVRICETYHLRIVIGDVKDKQLDSAVFLEAGSFNLGGSVTLGSGDPDAEQITVSEGCSRSELRIIRGADSNLDADQTVRYTLGGPGATATPGVDLNVGTGEVTIPAGEAFATIPVTAVADGLEEETESIWVYLDIPCACYTDSIEILIADARPLDIGLEEAAFCPSAPATLKPAVTGGVPPYNYRWSFGSNEARPTVRPPLPDSVGVIVTDACGQTTSKRLPSRPVPPPTIYLPEQNLRACRGEDVDAMIELTGQGPFDLTYLVDGRIETAVFQQASQVSWELNMGGTYELVTIEDQACRVQLDTSFRVDFLAPVARPIFTEPSCFGEDDGRIEIRHLPTEGPYTYEFAGFDSLGLIQENLRAGTYGVTITDGLGCKDERDLVLTQPPELLPIQIECEDLRRPPLNVTAMGGAAPYEYSIDRGRTYFDREALNTTLLEGQTYDLYIRDSRGCVILDRNFFWPEANRRMVQLPSFYPQELAQSTEVTYDYLIPRQQITTYQWSPAELFDCPACPNPDVQAQISQPISLVVTDIYGCTDSLLTRVAVDGRVPVYVPNIFSPNNDGINDIVTVYANPIQVERILTFRIFNRWGGLVWEDGDFGVNEFTRGWDGKLRGEPATAQVFAWSLEVRLTNGEVQTNTGTIALTR